MRAGSGSHEVNALCPTCRASPWNRDWIERWRGVELDPDAGGDDRRTSRTLADLGPAARPVSVRDATILRLLTFGHLIPVERRSRAGRFRGVILRRVDYSLREVARIVGCSVRTVGRVRGRHGNV